MDRHKALKVIGIIILLAIGFSFAGGKSDKEVVREKQISIQEIDTTKLEKYEKKVIIDARWGSGPGEFGKIDNLEGPSVGPAAFTVSSDGCIYVLDNINERIQKFDSKGNFVMELKYDKYESIDYEQTEVIKQGWGFYPFAIAVDEKDYVYLLGSILPNEEGQVRKYNYAGRVLLKYDIPLELLDCYTQRVRSLDSKTNAILQITASINTFREFLKLEINEERVVINNVILGSTDTEYSTKTILEKPQLFMVDSAQKYECSAFIVIIPPKYDSIKVFLPGDSKRYTFPSLLKIGRKNIYLTRYFESEEGTNEELLLYNKSGNLIAKINVKFKQKYEWSSSELFQVSDAENIYTWENDEYGVKIFQFCKTVGGSQ